MRAESRQGLFGVTQTIFGDANKLQVVYTVGDGTPVLGGWRRALLGPDFEALVTGRAALALDPATRKPVLRAL